MFLAIENYLTPWILIKVKSKLHYKISQNSLGTVITEREVIGRKQCHAINDQSEDRLRSKYSPVTGASEVVLARTKIMSKLTHLSLQESYPKPFKRIT